MNQEEIDWNEADIINQEVYSKDEVMHIELSSQQF